MGPLTACLVRLNTHSYMPRILKNLISSLILCIFLFKGAVQEVMYTHSNQRVVGGSKAEEMISRAAVRDVFERKIYSQLPANHILDNTEVHTMAY